MNTAPLQSALDTATLHYQGMIDDCAKLSHRLARLLVEQAEAGEIPAVQATMAFERATRSVRRCVWLIHKLAAPVKSVDRVAARKRIIRVVEDNIERHADESEAKTLHGELSQRLDSPDLEDDIASRPVEDIITDILRDLGLADVPGTVPWTRRTPEDVALLCRRAAQCIPDGTATNAHPALRLDAHGIPEWDLPNAEADSTHRRR